MKAFTVNELREKLEDVVAITLEGEATDPGTIKNQTEMFANISPYFGRIDKKSQLVICKKLEARLC